MDEVYNCFPAKILGNDGNWCVVLEAPNDRDDFVVLHRAIRIEDCHVVASAVNNILQEHIKHFVENKLYETR